MRFFLCVTATFASILVESASFAQPSSNPTIKELVAKLPQSAQAYQAQIQAAYANHEDKKVRVLIRDLADSHAKNAIVLTYCATYMNDIEDYVSVITYSTDALKIDPKNSLTRHLRGAAYYFSGQYQKAIDDLTQAITLNSKVSNMYHVRALAHSKLNQYSEALKDIQAARKISDTNMLHLIECVLYVDDLQLTKGLKCLNGYLDRKPSDWQASRLKISVLMLLGKNDEAQAEYTRIAKHTPVGDSDLMEIRSAVDEIKRIYPDKIRAQIANLNKQ